MATIQQLSDIGVYGMGVMGKNLALNFADHDFHVSIYNVTRDLTDNMLVEHPHKNITASFDLHAFAYSLQKPRRILLMIQAGHPVDEVIESLLPILDKGDVIIDGGNSFFEDTVRRSEKLEAMGLHYFGMGISGGERGARNGPALMPGGTSKVYDSIRPILETIAAKASDGTPCCAYIGTDGAGHYVKMVHNGIEYADMQLIAEAYLLLKIGGKMTYAELANIFHEWNKGELKSYLIGITTDVLAEKDEDDSALLDKIADKAGQKGTGRWTAIQALKQTCNASIIQAACNARVMSNFTDIRKRLQSAILVPKKAASRENMITQVHNSLYAAKIAAYAQGFALYRSASEQYGWHLNLGEIASIFRAGCIIQADFLGKIKEAYDRNPNLQNLLEDNFFLTRVNQNLEDLRQSVAHAAIIGIPAPAMMNALCYIDALRSPYLGANLIQGQRDYFGAHTFERTDKLGSFHHEWHKHFANN